MLKSFLLVSLFATASISAEIGHNSQGSHYGEEGILSYAASRHGPDGSVFLDPYFVPVLTDVKDKLLLDAGCGAGPWSVFAAEHGAQVCGIDLQPGMIDAAAKAAKKAGVADLIEFSVGDVADLPYENSYFDLGISINVGCSLPSTGVAFDANGTPRFAGLGPHCLEMTRVLKEDGAFILTAPSSFGVVFTDGTCRECVDYHIEEVLEEIESGDAPAKIASKLQELHEVNLATFAWRAEHLCLITDESELKAGEEIWRKIPGLAVPNYYHSEEEYLDNVTEAGFRVEKIYRPCFKNALERESFLNDHPQISLGEEYIGNPPYVIFHLRKK